MWNTQEIIDRINTLPEVTRVEVDLPGGDYDTENLTIYPINEGQPLYLRGFCTPEDDNIGYAELNEGFSDQHLTSNHENTINVYHAVAAMLKKDGLSVISHYDEIF